ncbi:MAG: hypothetical protein A2Z34_00170 [Planctomycetes bacterium RBG_16_59_8]|nr:MAG: hypothetical protein A2Z34_00170 [Planctomycetes bacterium RBG_16_59_8]
MKSIASLLALGIVLSAAPPAPRDETNGMTGNVFVAAERGLRYLAGTQNENGSWSCKIGYKLNEDYYGEEGEHVGVTALACMAFVAGGNTPTRGRYAAHVAKGLDFIIDCVREEDGYITHDGTRMYSHAFATMFLAEVYGMDHRHADVRRALKNAVRLIVNSQNEEGGWRYQPIAVDADLSVTVSTLQALRAARNAGINIPRSVIDRAMRYVKRCATRHGFAYQMTQNEYETRYTYAVTAAGLVSLFSAGEYDTKEVDWGLAHLEMTRNTLEWGKYHYFYGHYYAVQAMYQAGGRYWRNYFPRVRDEIIGRQNPNGSCTDDVGLNYATAMACVILQIPVEYLPIFQR